MLKEFKAFIASGNVIEFAVAVIMAGAIGTVVKGETGKSISVAIYLLNRSVIARLPDESSLEAIRETSN